MMKKTLTLSIALLLIFKMSAQNQDQAVVKGQADYLVKYKVVFALDSNNRTEKTTETHYLYTGPEVSFYASMAMIRIDSLMEELKKLQGNRQAMMRKAKEMREESKNREIPGFTPVVYKDFSENEVWVASQVSRNRFIYKEPAIPLSWEFGEEVKQIGNRQVHQATTTFGGRDWIAWFTMDVPLRDGPYVFSGLPGLILELYDRQKDYHFSVISIAKLKEAYLVNSSSNKHKKLSKDQFIKAYKKYRKNPLGPMASKIRGLDIKLPDPLTGEKVSATEFLRRIKEFVAKRNNYIERW